MITPEGFVTQSWLKARLHNFWGSYHKWLETGLWSSYQVIARFMQLCCLIVPEARPLFLIIDDTFVLRFTDKAPGSTIAFQHAHKQNQAVRTGPVFCLSDHSHATLNRWRLNIIAMAGTNAFRHWQYKQTIHSQKPAEVYSFGHWWSIRLRIDGLVVHEKPCHPAHTKSELRGHRASATWPCSFSSPVTWV